MFYTQVTTYVILTIIYIVTILYLLVTLDKLVADKEELQTRSVKRQFWFFHFGFMCKTVYYFLDIVFLGDSYFASILTQDILSIFWNVTPIAYVLFEHNRTFRAQGTVRRKDSIDTIPCTSRASLLENNE